MQETLIIHVGEFDNLDGKLANARMTKRLSLNARALGVNREPGPTVLLASSADKIEPPSVYMIVGSLRKARFIRAENVVEFDTLERFPVPVVVSNSAGAVREDLLIEAKFWSPSDFYWAPDGSAERCIAEAKRLREPVVGKSDR